MKSLQTIQDEASKEGGKVMKIRRTGKTKRKRKKNQNQEPKTETKNPAEMEERQIFTEVTMRT